MKPFSFGLFVNVPQRKYGGCYQVINALDIALIYLKIILQHLFSILNICHIIPNHSMIQNVTARIANTKLIIDILSYKHLQPWQMTLILTFVVTGTMLNGSGIIENLLKDPTFINIVQRVSVLGSFRWTYTISGHLGGHLEL